MLPGSHGPPSKRLLERVGIAWNDVPELIYLT